MAHERPRRCPTASVRRDVDLAATPYQVYQQVDKRNGGASDLEAIDAHLRNVNCRAGMAAA